jgi:hypothetical protein
MKTKSQLKLATGLLLFAAFNLQLSAASAFEGRITATVARGGETETFLYTVGTNQLRIERGETDRPYPQNIVNLDSGDITLLFPHNRSFVRLKNEMGAHAPSRVPADAASAGVGSAALPTAPGAGALPVPQMPAGVGPQPGAFGATPNGAGGAPALPMPMMPPPMTQNMELKSMGQKTNLLGFACEKYELKQRGEVMEIWATDKLLPFQPYLQNQPHRFGPRMMEEQWGELLKAKKLFPLLAVLRFEAPPGPAGATPAPPGPERLRFEVKTITPEKIRDETLFEPPPDYHEIEPLPF